MGFLEVSLLGSTLARGEMPSIGMGHITYHTIEHLALSLSSKRKRVSTRCETVKVSQWLFTTLSRRLYKRIRGPRF